MERARTGVYSENITLDVSPERLRRFFVKVDGGYQIAKSVRDMCIFASQNLVKYPPLSKLDLISCRNVLILPPWRNVPRTPPAMPPRNPPAAASTPRRRSTASSWTGTPRATRPAGRTAPFARRACKSAPTARFCTSTWRSCPCARPLQPALPPGAVSGDALPLGRRCARLKSDLAGSEDNLQSIIEEQEATNEELETAKEELQSATEELSTVNEELQNRNLELSQAIYDLSNLLASVKIPVVMLGNDLRIRRFTPAAARALNPVSTDIGRPITDIKPNIVVAEMDRLVLEVIESVSTLETEVQGHQGH